MNQANVLSAIHVMKRVRDQNREFNMSKWQHGELVFPDLRREYAVTEAACGTACCFGGWLALSPEWQEQGGSVVGGVPFGWGQVGAAAIARFFDIPRMLGVVLTKAYSSEANRYNSVVYDAVRHFPQLVNKEVFEITPNDIIEALYTLQTLAPEEIELYKTEFDCDD